MEPGKKKKPINEASQLGRRSEWKEWRVGVAQAKCEAAEKAASELHSSLTARHTTPEPEEAASLRLELGRHAKY